MTTIEVMVRLPFRLPALTDTLELWQISADGGAPENLGVTLSGPIPFGLSVHPDGRRIVFTAGMPRRPEVWVPKNLLPKVPPKR